MKSSLSLGILVGLVVSFAFPTIAQAQDGPEELERAFHQKMKALEKNFEAQRKKLQQWFHKKMEYYKKDGNKKKERDGDRKQDPKRKDHKKDHAWKNEHPDKPHTDVPRGVERLARAVRELAERVERLEKHAKKQYYKNENERGMPQHKFLRKLYKGGKNLPEKIRPHVLKLRKKVEGPDHDKKRQGGKNEFEFRFKGTREELHKHLRKFLKEHGGQGEHDFSFNPRDFQFNFEEHDFGGLKGMLEEHAPQLEGVLEQLKGMMEGLGEQEGQDFPFDFENPEELFKKFFEKGPYRDYFKKFKNDEDGDHMRYDPI